MRPAILDAAKTKWPTVAVQPVACADALMAISIEHPQPELLAKFLSDFGLSSVSHPERILLRSKEGGAFCYIIEQGSKARVNGFYYKMSNQSDASEVAARLGGTVKAMALPGGGSAVETVDPLGAAVTLVWDCEWVANPAGLPPLTNVRGRTDRINMPYPSNACSANVRRIGHIVVRTPQLREAAEWYVATLGMIASDVQTLPSGEPALVFLRCNRGDTPADHHTTVFSLSPVNIFGHVAFEVEDLDSLALGQQHLRACGWEHRWGLGRHAMGSQLFDYWAAPGGLEHEHYADGDLLSSGYPTRYSPFTLGSLWSWGHDLPSRNAPGKFSDIPYWPEGVAEELGNELSTPGRPWQQNPGSET
jgi:catechol 2,3-dioxygenase-like lactoylglutathione lyase family enzyme